MKLLRQIVMVGIAVLLVTGLGSCREDERNRPTSYEKGKYTGPKSAPLSEEQIRALRQRNRKQSAGGL